MHSTVNAPITERRLILIRHAKAMEEDTRGDHARHLSPRGQEDAVNLGIWLKEQGLTPQLALCSTATRTRETLAALGANIPAILSDKLYLAAPQEMLAQIQSVDEAVSTLLMVCHNPGAHALLGMLVDTHEHEADADRMTLKFPTAACAVMGFKIANWRDVSIHSAHLEQLRY